MEITDKSFGKEVLESEKPVMLEFWGSWCPPCKMMDPVVNRLEKEFRKRVKIGKINTDRNPSTRDRFDIRGVPTFIVFRGGKEVERHVAAKSEGELRDILNRFSREAANG